LRAAAHAFAALRGGADLEEDWQRGMSMPIAPHQYLMMKSSSIVYQIRISWTLEMCLPMGHTTGNDPRYK